MEDTAMNEAVIREKLMEISELILNSDDSPEASEGLYVPKNNTEIDSVIDELRMQIKYLMFDLDASHRENRYLRQMLEMRPPKARGGGEEGKI